MTITITVEDKIGDQQVEASRSLLDIELDYAAFDVACHTIKVLREEIETEKQRAFNNPDA